MFFLYIQYIYAFTKEFLKNIKQHNLDSNNKVWLFFSIIYNFTV